MKKIYLFAIGFLLFFVSHSQNAIPYGFNYQSIARDAFGLPIVNTQVTLRISVIEGNVAGPVVFREQQTATTNQFGLVNLIVGKGTYLGGTLAAFSDIDWASNRYFVLVEVENNSVFVSLGISQFQSVPYALASDNTLRLQNQRVSETVPVGNQILRFNAISGQWEPSNLVGANGGTMTVISVVSPLFISNGNPTIDPEIAIQQAGAGVDGYLSSLDWAIFNSKIGSADIALGDITGTFSNFTVTGLRGNPISNVLPTNGQVLSWNNTLGQWEPTSVSTGTVTTVTGNGPITISNGGTTPDISISQATNVSDGYITQVDYISFSAKLSTASGFGGDLSGNSTNITVDRIRNTAVDLTGLVAGQVLSFDGTSFVPAFIPVVNTSITSSTLGITTTGTNIEISTASPTRPGLLNPTDFQDFSSRVSTIVGLSGITINQNGTNFSIVGQTFVQTPTTLTGTNGITVAGTGFDLTVGGIAQNLTSQSASVTTSGLNFEIGTASGTNFGLLNPLDFAAFNNKVSTIVGTNGISINQNGSIYSIVGQTFVQTPTTLTGTNGITVAGSGFDLTVGGVAQNLTSQTASVTVAGLNLNIGTATGTSFGLLNPIDFAAFDNKVSTIVGVNGISINQVGNNYSISGANASQWTTTTNGIFYNSGDVAIGSSNLNFAQAKLNIVEDASLKSALFLSGGNISNGLKMELGRGATRDGMIGIAGSGSTFTGVGNPGDMIIRSDNNLLIAANGANNIVFANGISETSRVVIRPLGNVGIGVSIPGEKLVVSGNISATGIGYFSSISGLTLNGAPAGSVVTVDGNGTLGFGSILASTQWTTTTNGIYFSSRIGVNGIEPGTGTGINIKSVGNTSKPIRVEYSGANTFPIFEVDQGSGGQGNMMLYDNAGIRVAQVSVSNPTYFNGTGNFGIGTISPSEKLTVQGNSSVSGIGYFSSISGLALNGALIGSVVTVDGNGTLGFGTLPVISPNQWISSSTTQIYTNSFVGIGTSNPVNLLHVASSAPGVAGFITSSNSDNSNFINLYSGRTAANFGSIGFRNTGALSFGTLTSPNNEASYIELGRFTSGGNFGIGTTNPGERLTVQGNSSVTGIGYFGTIAGLALNGASVGSIVTVDGAGRLGFGTLTNSASQWTTTGTNIYFQGTNANNGFVGIGTNNPIDPLHLVYTPNIGSAVTGALFDFNYTNVAGSNFGAQFRSNISGSANSTNKTVEINTIYSTSLTNGNVFGLGVLTDAAGTSGANALIVGVKSDVSGAISSGTKIGTYSSVVGGANTNIGIQAYALGGTNNYAAIFDQGLVGIGLTAPTAQLDVNGTIRFRNLSVTGSILTVDGLGNLGIGTMPTSSSQWITTTSGNLFFPNQRVGIGGIDPQYDLHIFNPTSGVYQRLETPQTGNVFQVVEFKTGTYNLDVGSRTNVVWQMGLEQAGSGNVSNVEDRMYFGRSGITTNDFAVYRDGNVGINMAGATVPNERLTVDGNISATGIGYFSTISGLTLNGASTGSVVTVDGTGKLGFGSLPISTPTNWLSTSAGTSFTNDNIAIGVATTGGAALKVNGDISGKGQVIASGSMNPLGTAAIAFSELYRTTIYIPAGTQLLNGFINTYKFFNGGTGIIRIRINGTITQDIPVTTDVSSTPESIPLINVSSVAGQFVSLEILGQADATAQGVMVKGFLLVSNN